MRTLRDLLATEPFRNLPVLDIGDRVGFTGYIDFIKPKDMVAPMMTGRDIHGRRFIAVCVDIYGKDNKEYLGSGVGTFFERYSDSDTAIAFGTSIWSIDYNGDSHSNIVYYDSRVRGDDFKYVIERLNRLLERKSVYNYSSDLEPLEYATGNGQLEIRLHENLESSLSKLSI